jgi:hypothetical protein
MSLVFEIGIIVLGVLIHVLAIVGIIFSFKKKRQETALKFCWAGFGTILIVALTAWIAYRIGLSMVHDGVSSASASKKFEVQQVGIHLAAKPLTYAVFAVVIPILLNVFLLFRGLTLPTKAEQAASTAASSILTILCMGVGIGLLCISLLSYLDFDSFLFAVFSWMV